jgi:hypothetical protein
MFKNKLWGRGMGLAARYAAVGVVAALAVAAVLILLLPQHQEPTHYAGTPNGYQAFIPRGVVDHDGRKNPTGDLILDNKTTIRNTIWDGKYSDTIIQNHNQIVKLNNEFVGKINPVNKQPYVPLQDVYVIKGQVPIKEITINGQTYYVIDANKINEANVAGFYTYKEWVDDFVAALNTPGTYAAGLPGNSPVFKWTNTVGTVAEQTKLYGQYVRGFFGGLALVQPNGSIIPYGINTNVPIGTHLLNFINPKQLYNSSS